MAKVTVLGGARVASFADGVTLGYTLLLGIPRAVPPAVIAHHSPLAGADGWIWPDPTAGRTPSMVSTRSGTARRSRTFRGQGSLPKGWAGRPAPASQRRSTVAASPPTTERATASWSSTDDEPPRSKANSSRSRSLSCEWQSPTPRPTPKRRPSRPSDYGSGWGPDHASLGAPAMGFKGDRPLARDDWEPPLQTALRIRLIFAGCSPPPGTVECSQARGGRR